MKIANTAAPRNRQAGQTTVIVALVMGLFLLGMAGLAVDVTNWFFHRQMAQGAADAACTAGVMDLLATASSGVSRGNFPVGSPPATFFCSSSSTTAACQYAALNGYDGTGRVANRASNDVRIAFPSSVPSLSGLPVCSPTSPPPCVPGVGTVASPFILVDVLDRVPTTFTGIITGRRTTDVAASAVCGVIEATAPVPIIVLNPTCSHPFQMSGNPTLKIVGGPVRSVQVNSDAGSPCAAATTNAAGGCSASGPTIDLSQGGPSFNGSEFAVVGSPKTAPSGFTPGTNGTWSSGGPISDPYMLVSAPTLPAASPTDGASISVVYDASNSVTGCPDHSGCKMYKPGLYTHPIIVKGETAIFVPGIYYIQGTNNDNASSPGSGCTAGPTGQGRYGLDVDSNGVVRMALNSVSGSDGHNGVMFYLSGTSSTTYGSVFFGSNAGKSGGRTIDDFQTSNATCPGAIAPPSQLNIPTHVPGNAVLGQCTNKGSYIGAGSTDTSGVIRGLIFFQDRANGDPKGQASMQGGGGLVISGNMYFHNCNASGTGTNCSDPPSAYKAFYDLQGSPSGGTYVLGNITADELVLAGNSAIAMSLNPNAIYNILKASLLQ